MEWFWSDLGVFNQAMWMLCIACAAFAGLCATLASREYGGIAALGRASTRGIILGAIAGLVVALLLTGVLKETPTGAGTAGVLAIIAGFSINRRIAG